MHEMEHIGTEVVTERELYMLEIPTLADLPQALDTAGKYSVILTVSDATDFATGEVFRFARTLIDAGGVYFCPWGPGCDRIHDIIDEEWIGDGFVTANSPPPMTSLHNDDTLAEAVWFAIYSASPNDAYIDECRSVVAVCVRCPQWASEVREAFSDPERFSDRVLGAGE